MSEVKCEHKDLLVLYMSKWCKGCGGIKINNMDWQLPTRTAVSEGVTVKDVVDVHKKFEKYYENKDACGNNAEEESAYPPPSRLVVDDRVKLANFIRDYCDRNDFQFPHGLSFEIYDTFGVPGARELDFDKLFEITASVMKYGGTGHLVAVKVMEAYNTGKLFKK